MGREEEKGRETLMCKRNINKLALAHPPLGAWPSSQACALTGNWTENLFGLQDNKGFQDDTHTTELHQSGPYRSFTNKILYPRITAYCELCLILDSSKTNKHHPPPARTAWTMLSYCNKKVFIHSANIWVPTICWHWRARRSQAPSLPLRSLLSNGEYE